MRSQQFILFVALCLATFAYVKANAVKETNVDDGPQEIAQVDGADPIFESEDDDVADDYNDEDLEVVVVEDIENVKEPNEDNVIENTDDDYDGSDDESDANSNSLENSESADTVDDELNLLPLARPLPVELREEH